MKTAIVISTAVLLATVGVAVSQASRYEPVPKSFTTRIDNPYWPMKPGYRWVYREGSQRVVVTVTDRTKTVASGVTARVVHDRVTEKGRLVEDTLDWYAQDDKGNIWYLGEDTKEYEDGKLESTAGSWEAGVDGARAGIIMPARPRVGMSYRQEYLKGEAEDEGRVLSLDAHVKVRFGEFAKTLETKDFSRLEPFAEERKYFAKGIGPVLAITLSSGGDREELISFKKG